VNNDSLPIISPRKSHRLAQSTSNANTSAKSPVTNPSTPEPQRTSPRLRKGQQGNSTENVLRKSPQTPKNQVNNDSLPIISPRKSHRLAGSTSNADISAKSPINVCISNQLNDSCETPDSRFSTNSSTSSSSLHSRGSNTHTNVMKKLLIPTSRATRKEREHVSETTQGISNRSINKRQKVSKRKLGKMLKNGMDENEHEIDMSILSDEEAWEILRDNFNFFFNGNHYFLPDNKKELDTSKHVKGQDYFENLVSLRKHLCAYGMPSVLNCESNIKENIKKWIKFANIKFLKNKYLEPHPSEYEKMNFTEAFKLLKKLGFSYSSCRYCLPGMRSKNMKELRDGVDYFEMNGDTALQVHLARFGVPYPNPCPLTDKEMLSLDMFIQDCPDDKRDVFKHLNEINFPRRSRSIVKKSFSEGDEKCQLSHKSKILATDARKKTNKDGSQINCSLDVEKVIGTSDNTSNYSPIPMPKKKVAKRTSKIIKKKPAMKCTSTSVESKLSLGDILDAFLQRLSPSFLSRENLFGEMNDDSNISLKTGEITKFMEDAIESYQHGGKGRSATMYICGSPGTGKTTIINHCVKIISENYEKDDKKLAPVSKYINSSHVQCPTTDILTEVAKCIGKKYSSIERLGQSLTFNTTKAGKGPIVLILDEVDLLLKNTNNFEGQGKSFLEILFGWSSDPRFRLILIGISNSVGNNDAARLHKMGKIEKELIFESYKEEELVCIVKKRLGKENYLVEGSVITYVSRKVARHCGDARRVLELMRSSIIKCKEDFDAKALEKCGVKESVVKLRHVMKAIRDSGMLPYAQIISSLPQSAKVVLCVAMALSQVSPGWRVIKLADLKYYCAEATRHNVMEHISIDGLVDIVRNLEDSGVLKVGDTDDIFGNFYADPSQWPLQLGVQLDDVECALGESLLQQPFYKSLVDYVRQQS